MTVRGGYSASFLRAAATSPYPGATNTVSIVGSGTGVAIGDSVANQNVKLQQLAIDSGTPVGSGASAYGIRAVSSTVAVTNSSVVAQSGNDGSNGVSPTSPATPGGAGGDGPTGGAGTTPIAGAAGTGANPGGPGGRGGAQGVDYGNGTGHGGTGAQGNGPGGTGGVGGVNGSFNGLGGKKGLTGTAGTNGASGAGGALSGSAFGATFTPASGVAGTAGSAGSGGGGGGGGGDGCESGICSGASNSGGSGGGGGGGGAGGGAGSGGVSGGGSFAIWSYNSTVTVDTSSTIQSKNGGNGGNGGNGQAGAAGGAGGKGGNGACSTCTGGVVVGVGGAGGNPGNGVDGTDATGGFFTAGSGGGGGGGSGAGGGSGGGGGGGAGGATAGTVSVGTGGVTVPNAAGQITIGVAGTPGTGGGGPGIASGQIAGIDTLAPTLSSMSMKDTNGNGKVDQVLVNFNEPLASYSAGTAPWTLANVPSGGTLSSVSVAGSTATLTLAEGAGAPNTAVGSFTVALAANAFGIRDAFGNQSSFAATAPADAAAPVLSTLQLQDSNGNGKVDRIVGTFSEALATSSDASVWTLGGVIPSGGTKGAVSTSGTTATLLITEGGGAADTSVGSLTVALAAGAGGIRDATGNQASFTTQAPADAAVPVRTSLVMQDVNGNGKVDRVVATFSEPLASSTDNTVWTLANVPSAGTKGAVSTSGTTATLLITEGAGAANTAVGSFTVALAAGATGITDAAGNQSSFSAVAPTDGAAPALVSLVMQDSNTNGKVDRIVATYSETLVSSTDNTLWTLGGTIPSGGTKGALTTAAAVATLAINEGGGAPDTSVGTLTVALAASASGIKDGAGNLAPAFAATAPADGATPVRTGLVMQDANGNGKVDQVVATFSEPLASSTDNTVWTLANVPSAGTKGAVSTSGATATLLITEGAGAANTAVGTFTVALAAGATGIRDAAGNQSSFSAVAPTDGAAPALVSLVMQDANTNGKVDRVVATYSEALATSTDNTLWTLSGAIPSGGTKGAVSTSGSAATLLITEGAGAVDTSVGTLTVALANGASGIKDAVGNLAPAFGATPPSDGAAPIRTSLVMQDANANGKVDRIVATYSESLASSTDNTLWTLGGAIPSGGTKGALSTSGATATLLITEGGGAADTSVGTLTVAIAAGATSIRDAAGNQAAASGATAPTDGAAPVLLSLVLQDANANGIVDRIVATYSETLVSSTDNTLWTLGGTIPSGGTKGALSTSGPVATLLITEGAGAPDTSVGSLTVALTAGGTGMRDAAGNQAAAFAATAPADGAAPVRLSMVMQDTNGNGKVDRVVATFSETLASSSDNTVWTLANTPSAGTKGALSTAGATATLLITEGAGAADTGVGSFTVALAAGAAGIRDAAGNLSSFAAAAPSDGATPVLVSLFLRDNDANGKVDRIVATYSESLASSTDNTLWTLGGAIPSGGTKGALSTAGATATVLITEGAGAPDTSVGTLTVAIASGATSIRDAAGNQAAALATTAPTDGALPVRLSLVMQDANTNGKVDRIVATYSESLASSTDATLWTLGGAIPSGGAKGALSTSGAVATLLITEGAGAVDTGVGTLTVALANGATGIRDAAGNQAATFGATAPTDGAIPLRTALSMQDANTNGKVDRVVATYSEALATSTDDTLWTLGGAIPSGGTKGTVSTSGNAATLLISEGAGAADTSVGTLTVALAAGATGIRDAAGNQAAAFAATAPADGAAPVRLSMVMQDTNGNGKVDRLVMTFSESLVSTTENTTWTLANTPSAGTKGALSTSVATVTLLITEGAGSADTSVGSFTVALATSATGIRDAAGNLSSFAAAAPTDGAAPVRTALDLRDNDTNGKVDRIVATYSESLAVCTDATLWTLGGAIPSGGAKGTVSTSTNTATLLIAEGAGAADTAVGTLTVALTAGATGIRDAAGLQAAGFAATAPTDDASPVTVSVVIANNNGTVASGDSITVVYSEPVATLCTAWGANSLTANQSTTNLTGNFNNLTPDTFTVTNCAGFGTINLPGNNWVTSSRTITTTATWTFATRTLVLSFTAAPSGTVSNQSGTKTYAPGSLSDGAANTLVGTPPTISGGF
ncbi:MAG: beta strand repeat-containing protein [Acidimicrobiia bacterium]